jgi:hypothetical protein
MPVVDRAAELAALRAQADVLQAEVREDGCVLAVTTLVTGFQLTLRRGTSIPGTYDEAWAYPPAMYDGGLGAALLALASDWQHLLRAEEPRHWYRHRPSNRRRRNGDPALEEVRP